MTLFPGFARRAPRLHPVLAARRRFPSRGAARAFRAAFAQFARLSASAGTARFAMDWNDRWVCLGEDTETTEFSPEYVYHTAWAARMVAETRPAVHVDISSLLYFATLVSAFVPVKFYDYRPAPLRLDNLTSEHADLMALPFADGSVASLSCMHVVEHIGLGRYGDPVDPDGDLKAMAELARVLAPGGALLFVVPVGRTRIQYNAHRIYSYEQVVGAFPTLRLRQFAMTGDHVLKEGLIDSPPPEWANAQNYGCGCFWLEKPPLETPRA